jgi:hypothetical protein
VSRIQKDFEHLDGKTRQWTQYDHFKFDAQKDLVKQYDQLLFFGYYPGNPKNGKFEIPSWRVGLSSNEIDVIFEFMNAGGGVFESLSLCVFASLRLCVFASLRLCVFASLRRVITGVWATTYVDPFRGSAE